MTVKVLFPLKVIKVTKATKKSMLCKWDLSYRNEGLYNIIITEIISQHTPTAEYIYKYASVVTKILLLFSLQKYHCP